MLGIYSYNSNLDALYLYGCMKTKDKLGEELKRIREQILNFNQKELAEKLKVSHVYLSYLEQGKKAPSLELLENLYALIGEKKVPDKIVKLLASSKGEIKNRKAVSHISNNYVYLMEEHGLYDYKSLKKVLEREPDNLHVIHAMLILLLRDSKAKEAEQHLLDSLKKLEKNEDKKWIQACYNKLQGDLELAIQLISMSMQEFEKNNPELDEKTLKRKAHLLFQTACFYYDYGQYSYVKEKNYEKALSNFLIAIDYHHKLRELDTNPNYQMDYASIYFWLAFLGFETAKNWGKYIEEAKEALRLNYYEGINNLPSKNWNSVYSKPYIVSTYSFIARSYAELALLENDTEKKFNCLKEGENLFIQTVPIDIEQLKIEYYRFYFNQACFYSIKAEINNTLGKEFEKDLDICYRALLEAHRANAINIFKLLEGELNAKEGLTFFKEQRKDQLQEILSKIKKVK